MFKGLVLEEFLDLNLAVSLCLEFFNHGFNQKESVILLLTIPSYGDEVVHVTCSHAYSHFLEKNCFLDIWLWRLNFFGR